MNASCTRLVTGASDNQLRVWALDGQQRGGRGGDAAATSMVVDGDEEGEEKSGGGVGGGSAAAAAGEEEEDEDVVAVYMGSVLRQGNGEFAMSYEPWPKCYMICRRRCRYRYNRKSITVYRESIPLAS